MANIENNDNNNKFEDFKLQPNGFAEDKDR